MIQLEFEGMPILPRPTKKDENIVKEFCKKTEEILSNWTGHTDEDYIKDDSKKIVKQILEYHVTDGYKLSKYLDDDCNYYGIDFELADELNCLSQEFDSIYHKFIKEWVETYNIKCPFKKGDIVEFKIFKDTIKGEIVDIYQNVAMVSVFCEKMGHVKEGCGVHGICIEYEKVNLVEN